MIMRTSNPALSSKAFQVASAPASTELMTIRGTVNKTLICLALVVLPASWIWGKMYENPTAMSGLMMLGVFGGFIAALVTIFKKTWAPITTPIYCLLQGLFLGGISAVFERQYPGLVNQAVFLTFGTLFALLIAYKAGVRPSEGFKLGIVAATGGIAVLYFVNLILGFFGTNIPFIHQSSGLGIAFSVFVVIIAALNLVLDFDFIDKASSAGAPKYMEWYGAFGLMVTLVWLYLEILRLLAKLQSRR
jgi:uncharacterized YccA/Bax inhibitor family protein